MKNHVHQTSVIITNNLGKFGLLMLFGLLFFLIELNIIKNTQSFYVFMLIFTTSILFVSLFFVFDKILLHKYYIEEMDIYSVFWFHCIYCVNKLLSWAVIYSALFMSISLSLLS